ncbi:MAG: hypothetical protein QXJ48_02790 [Candidatus Korarchaeum sp.]
MSVRRYGVEELRSYLRSSKLVLVVTDDLSVIRYDPSELDRVEDLGHFGYSFSSPDNVSVWIRSEEGNYDVLEIENEELWRRYPHHELLSRKVGKPLREVI